MPSMRNNHLFAHKFIPFCGIFGIYYKYNTIEEKLLIFQNKCDIKSVEFNRLLSADFLQNRKI